MNHILAWILIIIMFTIGIITIPVTNVFSSCTFYSSSVIAKRLLHDDAAVKTKGLSTATQKTFGSVPAKTDKVVYAAPAVVATPVIVSPVSTSASVGTTLAAAAVAGAAGAVVGDAVGDVVEDVVDNAVEEEQPAVEDAEEQPAEEGDAEAETVDDGQVEDAGDGEAVDLDLD